MKKFTLFIALFTLFVAFAAVPVSASEGDELSSQTAQTTDFGRMWRKFIVTPGNPVTLEGYGKVRAKGDGTAHFIVRKGLTNIHGRGVLGVKASDNDRVKVLGFGKRFEVDGWVFYVGAGNARITGDHYRVIFFGKANTNAKGSGRVTYRGNWHGAYRKLRIISPQPIPEIIPDTLEQEAESLL